TDPPNGNKVPSGSKVTLLVSSGPAKVDVPDVKGESASDATSALKSKGFKVKQQTDQNSTAAPNTVVKQDPAASTSVAFGSTVTIFVSPGGSTVPVVAGQNVQVAEGNL